MTNDAGEVNVVYKKNEKILIRPESNNTFLFYNIETEEMFKLNRSAYIIYKKSIQCRNDKDIIEAVCSETHDNIVTASKPILDFIDLMLKKGVIYYIEADK